MKNNDMRVAKWGDSLAVRLPTTVVDTLELLARIRKYRGRLPPDFKFDRMEANERDAIGQR